ncbi:protein Tex24-like [Mus caroli]|uniref:Protein Tex24-like n=1 Tax=Mus caroli TaxID=10089 RepID=A0A6P5Q024_MUSCR|nr:protein Tex24-like [Mus caroli]
MSSQRLNSTFLKVRRLSLLSSNERLLGQTSGLATGSRLVTQGVNDLKVIPGSRPDLGADQPQHSLVELPSTAPGKRKPCHLPRLISSAGKGHAPDPNPNLSIVSKRIFLGESVVEGPEDRQTVVGPSGLPKNSPKATAGEAQGKKRTMELLNKARKQTEKSPNLRDIRQLLKQEVFMNNTHPCKKHLKQQPTSLEEWRRGCLGGDKTGLIQSQEPFGCCERLALEENTFLKGKKAQSQLLEVTSLQAEANPELLRRRRRMQALEMIAKTHDRGFSLEKAVFLSREKVKPSSQDIDQSPPERNNNKPKWRPKVEDWDHTVQGTPVVLTVRDHSYDSRAQNQWGCDEIFHSRDGRCT